jgi:hypothetical protein
MYCRDLNLLDDLRAHADAGRIWVPLKMRRAQERRLFNEGVLFVSPNQHTGEREYKITQRGRDMLEVFAPRKRYDGICPQCGERPRGDAAYCPDCARELNNEAARRHRERRETVHTDKPCAICNRRPRAVSSYGIQQSVCSECATRRNREYRARRQAERRARVEAGEVLICTRCGKRPVTVSDRHVGEVCSVCGSKSASRSRRRQQLMKQLGKGED